MPLHLQTAVLQVPQTKRLVSRARDHTSSIGENCDCRYPFFMTLKRPTRCGAWNDGLRCFRHSGRACCRCLGTCACLPFLYCLCLRRPTHEASNLHLFQRLESATFLRTSVQVAPSQRSRSNPRANLTVRVLSNMHSIDSVPQSPSVLLGYINHVPLMSKCPQPCPDRHI